MKFTNKIFIFGISLFIFDILLKAETMVSAIVDRQTVPINESVTLVLTITGEDATSARPEMPSMPNFNVYDSGRSSNISIINGRISSSVEYTYVLTPRYIGKTKIPPIGVFTGREKLFTKEIEITVVKATTPPPQTHPKQQNIPSTSINSRQNYKKENLVFLKAEIDKEKAYVGEQINLTIRFYTAIPIASNPQYFPPKIENLISEDLPPARNGETIINNVRYYYTELKTALFGIQPGIASIGPAQVIAQIQNEENIDPFDPNFIQKFFSGFTNIEEMKLNTKQFKIEILPLPEPQPPNFSNAVGNFFISAETDRKEAKQGEAINLTVKISGKGNIKTISKPELKNDDFKIYDTLISYNTTKNNDIIGGEKKFTYIISSRQIGTREIPSVKFSFFNIDTKKYEEIETTPIKIKIIEGEASKTYDFTNSQQGTPSVTKISSDIKYIFEKTHKWNLIFLTHKLSQLPFHWAFISIFPALISFLISKTYKERISNPFLYAFKNAESTLNSKIKLAKKENQAGNYTKALTLIYDGIIDYLTAKLKHNIHSLTIQKIIEMIKSNYPQINDYAMQELKSIMDEIEFSNYALASLDGKKIDSIIEKTKAVVDILEKEFEK